MGDERAEAYLRLLGEVELRRAGGRLRDLDAAALAGADAAALAGPDAGERSARGMTPFAVADGALSKVGRAGRILVAAGAVDEDFLVWLDAELYAAFRARSRILLDSDGGLMGGGGRLHATFTLPGGWRPPGGSAVPSGRAGPAMRVTPIGRALRVASERAPSVLHLLSLVRTGTEAVVTVVMRMHWPPDGSSTDLEIMGAGPHHLPFGQLWAVDDRGARYAVQFGHGSGGTTAWRGTAALSPVPPRDGRWLDLVGDGTSLVRLPLASAARHLPAGPVAWERSPVALSAGERLLSLVAERILATGDARGLVGGPGPGEIITVLTEAGAITADSPLPGQLAGLCQRLGAAGQGISVAPVAEIPAQWASVIGAAVPADGPEVFAPLADVLPSVDGARFALAGLSTAGGETHLHVVCSGMPQPADWFGRLGFSWWLRDSEGNWHVGTVGEPSGSEDGTREFLVRLTPPLAAVPDVVEVVVTGRATRLRATVPVRPDAGTGGPVAR